jgi:hypothetical protein
MEPTQVNNRATHKFLPTEENSLSGIASSDKKSFITFAPGCHSDPARDESLVETEEALIADGDHQAVHRVFVQKS